MPAMGEAPRWLAAPSTAARSPGREERQRTWPGLSGIRRGLTRQGLPSMRS